MSGRCRSCGAPDGYCQWSCDAVQAVEDSHARAVRAHADGLIGRWMTVEASKCYAALHYRHEASLIIPDRDGPGAMHAEQRDCAACSAPAGMPCAWDCIGLAAEVDRLDDEAQS